MQQVSLRDYCQEARSLIQAGEPEKTIPIVRHILRHYPHHVESYRLLAQALLAEGDLESAARQFGRVLSADPEDVSSRIGLAQIHRAKGDLGKAVRYMQRAVELSPGDPDLRVLHSEFVEAHEGDGGPDAVEITQAALGRIQADAGLYAKAVQEFKAVLQQNPDRADVQTTLAQVLWQMGDELQAAEICQRILEKLPNALKANLIIGALWLKNHQPDEAEPYLRTAQGLDPENLVAQSLFGEASPLPLAEVYLEPLGEEEIESVQQPSPPILPEDSTPVSERREPAVDWMSELHEEEFTPMSDEERADEEFELPDWLKGVGDDLLGESDEQPVASRPDEPELEEEEQTPSWLRDLVARAEESGAAEEPAPAEPGDAPSWLQELRPELSEETPSEPETPDWLSSIEEAPPDEEWLRTTADVEETPSAPYEPEPLAEEPHLPEPEAPVIPVAAEARDDDSDLPDWLREIREGKTEPEPEAEGAIEELESSLLEPAGDAVEESDVPDWLREITTGEPTPSDEAELPVEADQPTPEVEIDEEGLPDWLRTFAEPADEAEITETQPEAPEVSEESVVTADEGRALWQQILAEEGVDLTRAEEAPPEEAAGMTAEEWLRSTVGLEETPVSSGQPEVVAEEPEAERPEALEDMREPEGELPDWMREFQEPAAGAEPPVEPVAEEEAEEVLEVEVDEAGLPDWLQEPTAETAESLEPAPAAPAETPEWLTEIESEEMLMMESDFEEPMDLETGEMPEWLGEVIAGEPPLSEEWAAESEQAEAMEAQVPEWLREFRELGLEAAEPTAEAAEFEAPSEAEEQEEFAEPPELPEWLVHLREGVVEAEAPPPIEEMPPEVSVEAEAEPLGEVSAEPEVAEVEEGVPEWMEEPAAVEEGLPEPELIEEEELPTPEVIPSQIEPQPVGVPELAEVAEPERVITRELEALSVEDLPKDPGARLSMARGALDTGDWTDALMIYETLVSSSEMLDTVIENLEVGVSHHPDDPAGYQLLGDACMKDGRLGAALEAYRTALSKL